MSVDFEIFLVVWCPSLALLRSFVCTVVENDKSRCVYCFVDFLYKKYTAYEMILLIGY
jgi:hypothetical protein